MTIDFFTSVNKVFSTFIEFFASADLFTSANPYISDNAFTFTNLSTFTNLIIFLLSACLLLSIIPDITKFFYIKKPIISADNTTIIKIIKSTIWIVIVFFLSLNKVWQYILEILDQVYQLEVAKDILHQ